MKRGRRRGLTLVETMVGAIVLAVCSAPMLGSVAWVRARAADATIDGQVATALGEQFALVRSLGRSAALTSGVSPSTKALGNGVTLSISRIVTAVTGKPRLYDVIVSGAWTSRGEGGKSRTLILESYVFAPDN